MYSNFDVRARLIENCPQCPAMAVNITVKEQNEDKCPLCGCGSVNFGIATS